MTGRTGSVVIVGGSVAGIGVAETLRRTGHVGAITIIDEDPNPPYDRPPLSKQYLAGQWREHQVALRPEAAITALDATWIRENAVGLDVTNRRVRVRSGRTVGGDAIVIATGVRPRLLESGDALQGAHVLRTLSDARMLREAVRAGRSMTVVGNGVLGSEIAATAAGLGAKPVLIGRSTLPMLSQLGQLGAGVLARKHQRAGVVALSRERVTSLGGTDGHVSAVRFADGTEQPAHTVVLALGSHPATGWLDGSGLQIPDGVQCDSFGRAADGVWAAGDVARWEHPHLQRSVRWENRTNAVEMAGAVARDILGQGQAYAPVPYFWTDQLGTRVQVYGSLTDADTVEILEGDIPSDRFVAIGHKSRQPVGVLGWGMPKQARLASLHLHQTASVA